ncbi:hypothetical protein HPP92_024456 [Vanilla planifolia]|uniref:Uncharacterized protein n=1 Tax=Vanilla planifolia TaxID=51239 RepID=A0A835PKW0_VANPL|nr:hypothetical protein HPP92_024456 [Vanilla planifolia]
MDIGFRDCSAFGILKNLLVMVVYFTKWIEAKPMIEQTTTKADIVIINPFSWSMLPLNDCISSLVYSMRTENIESVMCNGHWILKDKKIVNVNEEEVLSLAVKASSNLLKRAAISLPID